MEYVPETVYRILKYFSKMKQIVPEILTKLYIYQLSRALLYIHSLRICHRDIKPHNLLVDPITQCLKLCDFGSAKVLVHEEQSVAYMSSRYYRAPELIFGATNYTTQIDMWSIGCVLAELLLGYPIFPGQTGSDQLVQIIKHLGTPTKKELSQMNYKCSEINLPKVKRHLWSSIFPPRTSPSGIDLVSKLLIYNPKERLRAEEVLVHPFFDELRDKETKLQNGNSLPKLFNFTSGNFKSMCRRIGCSNKCNR